MAYADDPTVSATNILVVVVLALEVTVLLVAEGFKPMNFFLSKTNIVNLLLLGGSVYAMLRPNPEVLLVLFFHHLFTFVTLAKALRSRRLDSVVAGLRGGLNSVHHVGFLLLIVFYIYAVIGTLLLGRNDPFHFGTLHWSLITLFAMSNLENWSSVMEISIYGCNTVSGYPTRITTMPSSTNVSLVAQDTLCNHPHAHGLNIAAYFVSFIFISAYIMLNLFLGVVTSAMNAEESRCDYAILQQQCITKLQKDMHVSDFHLAEYRDAFAVISSNSRIPVGLEELQIVFNAIGIPEPSEEEFEMLLHELEIPYNGELEEPEFIKVYI
jgi:hypothetical protein